MHTQEILPNLKYLPQDGHKYFMPKFPNIFLLVLKNFPDNEFLLKIPFAKLKFTIIILKWLLKISSQDI